MVVSDLKLKQHNYEHDAKHSQRRQALLQAYSWEVLAHDFDERALAELTTLVGASREALTHVLNTPTHMCSTVSAFSVGLHWGRWQGGLGGRVL